jgi:hypothetical protein
LWLDSQKYFLQLLRRAVALMQRQKIFIKQYFFRFNFLNPVEKVFFIDEPAVGVIGEYLFTNKLFILFKAIDQMLQIFPPKSKIS